MAGNVGIITWRPGLDVIRDNIERYGDALFDGVEHVLEGYADEIENYMKANHRWINRTFAAERGLECFVERFDWGFVFAAANTVWYGVILENRDDLAIVGPTMEIYGPEMLGALKDLVS